MKSPDSTIGLNQLDVVGVRLPPITGRDRCDRCGMQAYVKIALMKGDLLFCGHHYAVSELALISIAIGILDSRDLINS